MPPIQPAAIGGQEARRGQPLRCSSLLGCIDVTGLDLALPPSDLPADFSIVVVPSTATLRDIEVVQHDRSRFTLTSPGAGVCDVDLVARSISVGANEADEHDHIAHFVADVVLPRVAGLEGRCLHASSVVIDGRAFAFLGTSGAGKSTLAARLALEGASLLGDDCALVRNGCVHPAHRPSRLWADSAAALGLGMLPADRTGKVSLSEEHGVVRGSSPARLHEALVVDEVWRTVDVAEALDLLLNETMRLVIPQPHVALDRAVEFLRSFGPRRTIARDATLADLRAL